MAVIVVPREGEHYLFQRCTLGDLNAPSPMYLRLYTNDYTPIKTSVFSSFTHCTYTGYTAQPINKGAWTCVLGTVDAKSYAVTTNPIDFTFVGYAGGGSVFGFYLTANLNSADRCICAMRFDASQACYNGLTIRLQPKIIMGDMA